MGFIFRITDRSSWNEALQEGTFLGELERDGFIHFSNASQVIQVANQLYSGQSDLLLLAVARSSVQPHLQDEDLYGLGETYPHLYAPLPIAAVEAAIPFPTGHDGLFALPEEVHRL